MGFIIHKQKREYFIDTEIINNTNLSWKARGILMFLLSQEEDYEVRVEDIISHSKKDGEIAVRTAFKELEKFGYMKMTRGKRLDKNKINIITGTYYDVFEEPQL